LAAAFVSRARLLLLLLLLLLLHLLHLLLLLHPPLKMHHLAAMAKEDGSSDKKITGNEHD
jgi:hypothetical protein